MMSLLPIVLFLSLTINITQQQKKDALPDLAPGEDFPDTTKASSRLYDPNVGFEPYWPGGDWVIGVNVPVTITTSTQTLLCGDDCPDNYRWLGQVCVLKLSRTWWDERARPCPTLDVIKLFHYRWADRSKMFGPQRDYRYRCAGQFYTTADLDESYETMESYCHYLSKQCQQDTQGPKFDYVFVHLGKCLDMKFDNPHVAPPYLGDTYMRHIFKTNFDDTGKHVERVEYWERGVRERLGVLKQKPFVPHRWPESTTESTMLPQGPGAGKPGGAGGVNKLLLRDGVSDQEPLALSETLQAWQDYLRVLR